ncbi:hypothetical protein Tco_0377864, partial [Tanacetum coccineum]
KGLKRQKEAKTVKNQQETEKDKTKSEDGKKSKAGSADTARKKAK